MNSFADALFTMLFGWLRAGVQTVWNSTTQGRLAGFFPWLGDHWLAVLLVLCAVCTVLDYLVWLVRWRPYLVWRTKLRRALRSLRGRNRAESRAFEQGYDGGVSMDALGPLEPPPVYEDEGLYAPPPPAESLYAPPAPSVFPEAEQAPVYAPPVQYSPVPESRAPLFPDPVPEAAPAGEPPVRHRRSEKHGRAAAFPRRHDRLPGEDGVSPEGLPPAVNQEEAFHDPVYPAYPDSQYAAWQGSPARRPQDHQESP